MAVDSKTASNRRDVSYDSYDDLLADAERLAGGQVETVGNWSLGQIFQHLAVALNGSIDGLPFRAPFMMRVMAKLFMKKKFLTQTLPSGFQIPEAGREKFVPAESVTTEEGLAALREAIARCKSEPVRAPHPVLKLSRDQWDQFSLRHAELHMSFARAG